MLLLDMVQGTVLARVKGCPEDEAVDAMRNACIEFCERTRFLTDGSTVVVTGNDIPDFIDMTAQVIDIIEARIEGETEPLPIYPMNDPRIDELCDGERAVVFADPNTPSLVPPATNDQPVTLELLLAYAPGPTANEVPDILWLRHSEALKHGALGRLHAIPGEAWSDDKKAAFHLQQFEQAISRVAFDLGRNRLTTSRRLRVKPL